MASFQWQVAFVNEKSRIKDKINWKRRKWHKERYQWFFWRVKEGYFSFVRIQEDIPIRNDI